MGPVTINIAVLHGQAPHREALCDFIADEVGFHVVGGADTAAATLDLMRVVPAHVLVVDLESAGDGALELLSSARALSPGPGILLLVHGQPLALIEELMARGAAGYLETARVATQLTAALRTIGMGRRYLPHAEASAT
jgi:two-component system, NarL family, invasion response regulator UvrY